jgi:hypothetical protein
MNNAAASTALADIRTPTGSMGLPSQEHSPNPPVISVAWENAQSNIDRAVRNQLEKGLKAVLVDLFKDVRVPIITVNYYKTMELGYVQSAVLTELRDTDGRIENYGYPTVVSVLDSSTGLYSYHCVAIKIKGSDTRTCKEALKGLVGAAPQKKVEAELQLPNSDSNSNPIGQIQANGFTEQNRRLLEQVRLAEETVKEIQSSADTIAQQFLDEMDKLHIAQQRLLEAQQKVVAAGEERRQVFKTILAHK